MRSILFDVVTLYNALTILLITKAIPIIFMRSLIFERMFDLITLYTKYPKIDAKNNEVISSLITMFVEKIKYKREYIKV